METTDRRALFSLSFQRLDHRLYVLRTILCGFSASSRITNVYNETSEMGKLIKRMSLLHERVEK